MKGRGERGTGTGGGNDENPVSLQGLWTFKELLRKYGLWKVGREQEGVFESVSLKLAGGGQNKGVSTGSVSSKLCCTTHSDPARGTFFVTPPPLSSRDFLEDPEVDGEDKPEPE